MRRGSFLLVGMMIAWFAFGAMALVPLGSSAEPHGTIVINSPTAFTTENGVTSGSGTQGDPYVIEGWTIYGNETSVGILIQSTSEYLVIRNLTVSDCSIGISIFSASNVVVTDCSIVDNVKGVSILYSDYCSVVDNVVTMSDCGICVYQSENYVVSPNTYINNRVDVSLPSTMAEPKVWLTVAALGAVDGCLALWAWTTAPRRYRRIAQSGARVFTIVLIQILMIMYVINYLVIPAERGDIPAQASILATYLVVGLCVGATTGVALWGTRLVGPELR